MLWTLHHDLDLDSAEQNVFKTVLDCFTDTELLKS